jgi:enterochelin esterase-like enzyme/sugar lactone lactonase YvrE
MYNKLLSILFFCLFLSIQSFAQENYPIPEDSQKHDGVPEGEILGPFTLTSEIFPGTEREYWVYMPKQYDPAKPACLTIVQDGLGRANDWKLPIVMDNLIHKKEIPVTIGIFVSWGYVPSQRDGIFQRFNRSFEYDSLGDRYARFLIEELIPAVGNTYNLSDDPNDRLLAGASSGAICAFNAAWERPDAFRRVLSTIGTYVGLRGAHEFPVLVRKMEPKPLRVFLQDGSNDLNIYPGSWWVANQDMLSSLEWAGYDVTHDWGEGGHNGKHSAAIMPVALRWLWRDYPEPVKNLGGAQRRIDLLIENEDWQLVHTASEPITDITTNQNGEIILAKDLQIVIGFDQPITFESTVKQIAVGKDEMLYAYLSNNTIVKIDQNKMARNHVEDIACDDFVVTEQGTYYINKKDGIVGFINKDGQSISKSELVKSPGSLCLNAEQAFLNVSDAGSNFGFSYFIQPDGALAYGQEYLHYHIPYGSVSTQATSMIVDNENRLYTATNFGIQVMDQLGRVHFIFKQPTLGETVTHITFGGDNLDELYAVCGNNVYKRKIKAKGAFAWQEPSIPPQPKL